MAHRRDLTVAPTPSLTVEVLAGSRPEPPEAGARVNAEVDFLKSAG